jgi:hypothetical protein
VCWVEVRLQEPAGSEAYWQAFRIAGEDLGVDITQADVELHLCYDYTGSPLCQRL